MDSLDQESPGTAGWAAAAGLSGCNHRWLGRGSVGSERFMGRRALPGSGPGWPICGISAVVQRRRVGQGIRTFWRTWWRPFGGGRDFKGSSGPGAPQAASDKVRIPGAADRPSGSDREFPELGYVDRSGDHSSLKGPGSSYRIVSHQPLDKPPVLYTGVVVQRYAV